MFSSSSFIIFPNQFTNKRFCFVLPAAPQCRLRVGGRSRLKSSCTISRRYCYLTPLLSFPPCKPDLLPRNPASTRCSKYTHLKQKVVKGFRNACTDGKEKKNSCLPFFPGAFALMRRSCLGFSANCPVMAVVHCVCRAAEGKRESQEKTNKQKRKKKKKLSFEPSAAEQKAAGVFFSRIQFKYVTPWARRPTLTGHLIPTVGGTRQGQTTALNVMWNTLTAPTTRAGVMSLAQGKVKLRAEKALLWLLISASLSSSYKMDSNSGPPTHIQDYRIKEDYNFPQNSFKFQKKKKKKKKPRSLTVSFVTYGSRWRRWWGCGPSWPLGPEVSLSWWRQTERPHQRTAPSLCSCLWSTWKKRAAHTHTHTGSKGESEREKIRLFKKKKCPEGSVIDLTFYLWENYYYSCCFRPNQSII